MRVLVLIATGWRMSNDAVIAAALGSLAGARHGYNDAVQVVPDEPGLYAFYGDRAAWSSLGLTPAFDDQPLYVGKAERSLSGRDVRTHFAAGKTGSSTVRRSLAACWKESSRWFPYRATSPIPMAAPTSPSTRRVKRG